MLILLGTGLFLLFSGGSGGMSVEQMRERIPYVVADAQRLELSLAAVDRIEGGLDTVNDQLQQTFDDMRKVHQRYVSTEEDYQRVFDELDRVRGTISADFLSERSYLRSILNRAEWSALFAKRQAQRD